MRFEHERPTASETTPLLVPPTSAEEPQEVSQQLGGDHKPHFQWEKIVWVLAAIWSGVFLGALDGAHSVETRSYFFPDLGTCVGTIVATLMTPVRQVQGTLRPAIINHRQSLV